VVIDSGLALCAPRNDEVENPAALTDYYFFTNAQAASGGPNASSPEIFARIL
jgi:hypothetical protein